MHTCPICATPATARFRDTPYWMCPGCDCWFQSPPPPKIFEGAHEKDADGNFAGHLMSDSEKGVNRQLAESLFRDWLGGAPARTLDIGSKYPYLAHCLRNLGCEAFGMDNIEIVPEYSRMLGVPMLMADFEQISDAQIREWTATDRFRLITMVHVFEHMYDPVAALAKLRRLVADDGFLFVRLPDHGVAGFERDLTPGHYTIHPYYHALPSLLETLVRAGDQFTLARTFPLEGGGQRDLVLRPLTRRPVVYAGLIVKNEERDLPRCLRSIEPLVDGAVVVDTGSTDGTLAVATSTIGKPVFTQTYTGASRKDDAGDWKLWDFAKARNVFVEEIERRGADYVLWMDADDELLTPVNLRRALYWDQFDVFGVMIDSSGQRWTHHRLWKTGRGIRFEGRCHEYPTMAGQATLDLVDSVIRHDATPGIGETASQRNLRILQEEFAEKPNPRTAFYLANTHKDARRYTDAIPWYARRIAMGEGYRDEWLFAWLYKARCERAAGDARAAEATLLAAIGHERGWAEFWMELAFIAFDQRRWQQAIGFALQAHDVPIPATLLWRERNMYTDQPCRLISWCNEQLGDRAQALAWALRARDRIGAADADLNARIRGLEAAAPAPGVVALPPRIALHRPGAIGDIVMTLNLVPRLRAAWPGHAIHYVCDRAIGEALGDLMRAAGIDVIEPVDGFAERRGGYARTIDLIGYPLAEGYPEKPMRDHLLHYFEAELGMTRSETLPALVVARPPRPAGLPDRYATLQAKTGWSVYKNWPQERWEAALAACPDVPVFQIGTPDEPRVAGARHDFMGTPLSTAVALFANASLHLGVDSFANHLTHYLWHDGDAGTARRVPAIILWGSTQASAAGYPHNTNISLGLACQPCFREDPKISRVPRGPCVNPPGQTYDAPRHACMHGIAAGIVAEAIRSAWDVASASPPTGAAASPAADVSEAFVRHVAEVHAMPPSPGSVAGGRNVRAGHVRGWGLEFGGFAELIARDALYAKALAAARERRSLVTEPKLMNLYLIIRYGLANVRGDIVEFGSYGGGSAAFMATLLHGLGRSARVFALDTFEGMPETDPLLDLHRHGDFADASYDDLVAWTGAAGLEAHLVAVKGRFEETLPAMLAEGAMFGLAHVDCDIHDAVVYATSSILPYLSPGGYIVFDDPLHGSCLGALQAVEEVLVQREHLLAEQAYPHLVYRYPPLEA